MNIFIGADHNGFNLKNQLVEYLKGRGYEVHDMGNHVHDPLDDFPDFAQAVAKGVLENPGSFGVVMCGSGIGVSIAANRFPGIYCALAFNEEQVKHARTNDHCNIISLPSDHFTLEQLEKFIEIFIATEPKMEEKYLRRLKKMNRQH